MPTLRSSARGCVVLLFVLIMLVFLDYAALMFLAVNVAFIVGLFSLLCLLHHYIFDVYLLCACLVNCVNCAVM